MVQAIALLLPATATGTVSVFGITLATAQGLTLAGSLVNIGASLLLTSALRPSVPEAPRPANIQINAKSATAARIGHVGIVKTGGNIVFHRAKDGISYRIVVHGHGPITAILQRYLNNVPVDVADHDFVLDPTNPEELDDLAFSLLARQDLEDETDPIFYGAGAVLDEEYFKKRPRVYLFDRLGAVPSPHFSEITEVWPEWTSAHRLDGQWTTLVRCEQVAPERFRDMYPNGEPEVQVKAQTAACYDPRSDTTQFTENAALIIAHYIGMADGFNRPGALDEADLTAAANRSDQQVALATGGTEARWRLSGSYALTERPQDVLRRMLDACSGRLRLKPTGRIALELGAPAVGGFTLRFGHLVEVLEVSPGPDLLDRYNVLPARYVDHTLGFVEVDAEAWEDADRIAEDGAELHGTAANLIMAPSHRQARAVMKLKTDSDNPGLELRVLCKPAALQAVYEAAIPVDVPELGITGNFRVKRHNLRFAAESGLLETVTLDLARIDPAAGTLALDEQGLPQSLPEPDTPEGVPVPQNVTAAASGVQVAQNTWTAGIGIAWDLPPSDALTPVVEYRATGDTKWRQVLDGVGDQTAQIGGLVDGNSYDVRVAFMTPGEVIGLFVARNGIAASAVNDPPLPPSGLTVTDQGGGVALVEVTASASLSNWRTEILRDGVLQASLYSSPGALVSVSDTSGPGTFAWTARAVNVSAVASDRDNPAAIAGPVYQTIT